jgi:hypothetical protein
MTNLVPFRNRVEELLSSYFPPSAFLGEQAGHNHRWFNGSAFTK